VIDVYYWPTPNGKKVTIQLEEEQTPYSIKAVNIGRGDQLTPEFLKISPNGRMPAIVDHEPKGGGAPITIFESGAIMLYLAEKSGKFLPTEPRPKAEVMQWMFWQMANQGPKIGDQTYALMRFDNEVHRIYGVMNLGLHKKRYLAADQYTIADMICYPWAVTLQGRNLEISEFPNVKRWLDEIGERPAVKKAMAAGPEYREDPATVSPEEQARRAKLVNHQRAQLVPKEWG
jgi:GST-like protein